MTRKSRMIDQGPIFASSNETSSLVNSAHDSGTNQGQFITRHARNTDATKAGIYIGVEPDQAGHSQQPTLAAFLFAGYTCGLKLYTGVSRLEGRAMLLLAGFFVLFLGAVWPTFGDDGNGQD